MKLAFQLVTWNSESWLPYLIASLKAQTLLQTLPKEEWKLFVLDNGSADKSVALIQELAAGLPVDITILKENMGFARGHNMLFTKHDATCTMLLNPDTVFSETLLEDLYTVIEKNENTAAVTARLMRAHPRSNPSYRETDCIDSLGFLVERSRRVKELHGGESWKAFQQKYPDPLLPVFGISGALPMYRTSALRDVALPSGDVFDSLYHTYKEDVDLAFRLVSRGYTATTILSAVAFHARGTHGDTGYGPTLAWQKQKETFSVRLYSLRNQWYTLIKNEYRENARLDFLAIFWYEFTKLGWHVLFAPRVLWKAITDLRRDWDALQKERAAITAKRRKTASEVRVWWTRS